MKRPVRRPEARKMDSVKAHVEPWSQLSRACGCTTAAGPRLALRASHVNDAELSQCCVELKHLKNQSAQPEREAAVARLQPVRQLGKGGGSVVPGRAVVVRDE